MSSVTHHDTGINLNYEVHVYLTFWWKFNKITMVIDFIIPPCDPTVVFCYLIWPCDIDLAVCITYLISHSSFLTYNLRIFQFGCITNTKLPSCVDIIRVHHSVFPAGALKALVRRTRSSKHQL